MMMLYNPMLLSDASPSARGLRFRFGAGIPSSLTHAYQNMSQTGSGTSGTNTITASGSVAATSLVAGSVFIIGADTYTVSTISTVTITTTTNLINPYVAATMQVDTVSAWADKSGFGLSAAQATGSAQPSYLPAGLNGQNVVDFNPTGKGLTAAAVSAADNIFATGGTLMFVVNCDTIGTTAGRLIEKTDGAAAAAWNFLTQNNSGSLCKLSFNQITSATTGTFTTTNTVLTFGTTSVITFQYDASALTTQPLIRVNGTAVPVTTASSPTGTAMTDAGGAYTLGNRAALDRGMDGRMAACYGWNRVLSAYEISAAEHAFGTFWGATIS